MSQFAYALLLSGVAAVALAGMWLAWRARARRDAGVVSAAAPLLGEVIAEFPRVSYVSTTLAGAPFERVALPGLTYKGPADVTVRRDGVTVAVAGEAPVHVPAGDVRGTGTSNGRIGKAVERDGLSLLRWRSATVAKAQPQQELESGFRFANPAEQARFAGAVAVLADPEPAADASMSVVSQTMNHTNTTQEEA